MVRAAGDVQFRKRWLGLSGMTRQPRQPTTGERYSEAETVRRRDEAIRRALRTPPTHLKDIAKKRKPKTGAPPAKRDGA
jgi:hypothetical protein